MLSVTLGGYRLNTEIWCNTAVFVHHACERIHAGVESSGDLQDVYNRVLLYFLLYQLTEHNIYQNLVNWVRGALSIKERYYNKIPL